MFARDSRFLITGGIVGVGTTALGALIWVRLWGRLPVLSIYEYLEQRYHPGLRVVGSLLIFVPLHLLDWKRPVDCGIGLQRSHGHTGDHLSGSRHM